MIPVTKPYLPDIDKYKTYIDKIYKSGFVTNDGALVNELKKRLESYLDVKNILLVSNGTTALSVAYKLLELKGEVITTPFSFIATTSSIVWQNLVPKFADIDPLTLNICSKKIEQMVSKSTSAIVPVHVFGNVCEVEKIEQIARKYNLRVIYDAAQAFNVRYRDKSVLSYGDISIVSFHATKLFHTIEGGALIINDDALYEKAVEMINFGYKNGFVNSLGINAKMNEFEAAMGLCILDDMDFIFEKRRLLFENYKMLLKDKVFIPIINPEMSQNYSYFPIIFKSEKELEMVEKELNKREIFPRRYFQQSLDTLDFIPQEQVMPISRDISKRVLCLPIYFDLTRKIQKIISDIIHSTLDSIQVKNIEIKEMVV